MMSGWARIRADQGGTAIAAGTVPAVLRDSDAGGAAASTEKYPRHAGHPRCVSVNDLTAKRREHWTTVAGGKHRGGTDYTENKAADKCLIVGSRRQPGTGLKKAEKKA